MEHEMNCSKCGGKMTKVDDTTMKCEGCGNTMKIDEEKGSAQEM